MFPRLLFLLKRTNLFVIHTRNVFQSKGLVGKQDTLGPGHGNNELPLDLEGIIPNPLHPSSIVGLDSTNGNVTAKWLYHQTNKEEAH